jgi:hypothetical protein
MAYRHDLDVSTALDNGQRSPRKLLRSVVARLLNRSGRRSSPKLPKFPLDLPKGSYRREPLEQARCNCFAAHLNLLRELEAAGSGPDPYPAEYRSRQRALGDVRLHSERQDTDCDAWQRLLELVEEAAVERLEAFAPLQRLKPGEETQIVTLPATIAKLKSVKRFNLSGSSLARIPPEIGEMSNLEVFDPYTSNRLHWFPYEITRCTNLRHSRVSTRALYGNYKYRWPFPPLEGETATDEERRGHRCSVCDRPFDHAPHRAWISLWVATDVLPLLVNACSEACLQQLPKPAEGYVQEPHQGGLAVEQPDRSFSSPGPPLRTHASS